MKKCIITVLGEDRPGIIAAVAKALFAQGYNIEEASQTIMQNQFACFFIVAGQEKKSTARLAADLEEHTAGFELFFHVRELSQHVNLNRGLKCEPYVVTTRGPDRKGLVADITAVFAAHHVNVAQLRAVFRGGAEPGDNTMIYEVDIPLSVDLNELRRALSEKAGELDLQISIQHRNIFEAMNRVL